MKATLTIEIDDVFGQYPEGELARILRQVAKQLKTEVSIRVGDNIPVMGVNGNCIGRLEVRG